MNDRELLPCPHCGKTPRRQGDEYSERVVCQCGACTEWNDRYEVCIKLWNTRVTDPLIDEIAKQVATNYEKDMLIQKMAEALDKTIKAILGSANANQVPLHAARVKFEQTLK